MIFNKQDEDQHGLYTNIDEEIIITEVMKREGLYPEDISKEYGVNPANLQQIKGILRYFWCKAFASFDEHVDADLCHHSWKSAHAWIYRNNGLLIVSVRSVNTVKRNAPLILTGVLFKGWWSLLLICV